MNDNMALFIIDFDGTLVKASLHNYVGERLWWRIGEFMKTSFFQSDKDRDQMISKLTRKFSIELTKDFLADDNLGWKNKE